MAKNVTIQNEDYVGIKTVKLPLTSGGVAEFIDPSEYKLITGTFTTGSTGGTVETVTVPYDGSGYPIAMIVYPRLGAYNSSGNSAMYTSTQRYAIVQWAMTKSVPTSSPTFTTSGTANQGTTMSIFNNTTTDTVAYSRTSAMNTNVFSSSDATAAAATAVRFKSNKSFTVYVASTSYGLFQSTEYSYIILYSE